MTTREEHDKNLEGIRKTIEELKAERPPIGSALSENPRQKPKDQSAPSPDSPEQTVPTGSTANQNILPVVEERLNVSKTVKETGSITFKKNVHEVDISVDDTVTHEEVHLERVAVTPRYVDENPPAPYQNGDTTIIPVFHEVVEKQLILVEEVRITRHKKHSHSSHPLTLKKEDVRLNREPASGSSTKDGSEKRSQL